MYNVITVSPFQRTKSCLAKLDSSSTSGETVFMTSHVSKGDMILIDILFQNSGMFVVHKFRLALPGSFFSINFVCRDAGTRIKGDSRAGLSQFPHCKKAGSDLPKGDLTDKGETDDAGRSTLTMSRDNVL